MEIQFLGTGSAFCLHNHQSNLIVKNNDQLLLVDAGGDIRFSLKNAGYHIQDIDALYISHLHNDHIGGMEYIALYTYFNPDQDPLKLFIHQTLINELWENALKAGLSSVQNKILTLQDYFDLHSIGSELLFEWQNIQFSLVPTPHIFNGTETVFTFGLMIQDMDSGYRIYLTGDTQFNPKKNKAAYDEADIVIHDCETSEFKSGVHSHYDEKNVLDSKVKRKTYLWHYQDNVIMDFDSWQKKSKKDGFRGFITKGARFVINKNGIEYKESY
ncbi:metallo-beta-lactamase [Candidatus Magnetomorum sp. HK-1]|nr:metallo-beta-lactamase [Candidatus Magnetomorum sp. HK-1]